MTRTKTTGGCLCGAVRYEIEGPLPPAERYKIKGKQSLAWYESSPGIKRGFCKTCGSKLFWERTGSGQLDVTLGTIDPPTGLKIEKHIYLADAGDYYDPPSR